MSKICLIQLQSYTVNKQSGFTVAQAGVRCATSQAVLKARRGMQERKTNP